MTARLLCCALLAGLSLGCATSNDTAPTDERAAEAPSNPSQAQARAVILEGDVSPETVQALAQHLEGLAEVHSVEIAIEKTDAGPTLARLTLGGFDMPSTEELQAAVADFDGLTGDVAVSFDDAAAVPEGPVDAEGLPDLEGKTPAQIKAEVTEKLRADGVKGEIEVDVLDEDGERRVQVRVKETEISGE